MTSWSASPVRSYKEGENSKLGDGQGGQMGPTLDITEKRVILYHTEHHWCPSTEPQQHRWSEMSLQSAQDMKRRQPGLRESWTQDLNTQTDAAGLKDSTTIFFFKLLFENYNECTLYIMSHKQVNTCEWHMGDRAFCHTAPCLWNALPDHLRAPLTLDTFKKGLKTYLFKKAFY